jgi:hypothetical protein
MTTPDVNTVKAISKVDFESLEQSFDDPQLAVVVGQANAYISQVTGRQFASMPLGLEPIATQAVVLRTEQIALRAQEDYVETANDDVISSFSAGSYSEQRVDQAKKNRPLNTNPALNELLWMLLSPYPGYPDPNVDAMYDYWLGLLNGEHAPAFEVSEVDWSGTGSGLFFPSSPDDLGMWWRV